jgi:hypothetical protein
MKHYVFGGFLLWASASANALQIGGPAPGSGNAAAMSSNNREQNSSYNRIIGSGVTNAVADGSPKKGSVTVEDTAVAATAADVIPGTQLRDILGQPIGSIASVEAGGAVVITGTRKIRVPLVAFGKDARGLLLGITASKFQELASRAK